MKISTKLTAKDIVLFTLLSFYKKWFVILISGLMLLDLLFTLLIPTRAGRYTSGSILMPLIILAGLPLFICIMAIHNFKNSKRLSETIEYQFEENYLNIIGESFKSQMSWEKLHKVTKTKHWILIFQTRQIANIIPLRNIWAGDILHLKSILDLRNVKNNL